MLKRKRLQAKRLQQRDEMVHGKEAVYQLIRINSLLDGYGAPTHNPDFPDVKLNTYGRLSLLLKQMGAADE